MGKTSVSPIAFEFSKPFPLHSCKLHALLSAAYILFACLLELCDDCLTCPKVAKICQELKLGKGIAFIWLSSLITPPSRHASDPTASTAASSPAPRHSLPRPRRRPPPWCSRRG